LGGSRFEASLGKKFLRPHLNKQLGIVVYTYHPSYMGSIHRRLSVQVEQEKNVKPYFKNNKSKKGTAQVMEGLSNQYKALVHEGRERERKGGKKEGRKEGSISWVPVAYTCKPRSLRG
jgi:hypothetical protein